MWQATPYFRKRHAVHVKHHFVHGNQENPTLFLTLFKTGLVTPGAWYPGPGNTPGLVTPLVWYPIWLWLAAAVAAPNKSSVSST
jgi:hypothetical protein